MNAAEVQVADRGTVRVLAIDRPSRRNALGVSTAERLREELEGARAEPGVRAVVLTGVGEHFSAGGDAHVILERAGQPDDRLSLQMMRAFHRLVEEVWNSELPVVAAVSGVAYGGAFNLALACDLVVCSQDARFCQVFLRRGLVPDVGGAFLLPRLVGLQRAKELMFLCPELSAQDAHRMGLVNEVTGDAAEARARAVELAARLAENPPLALALTKRLVNDSTAGDLHSSLQLEAVAQALALRSDEARGRFASFLRREPAERGSGQREVAGMSAGYEGAGTDGGRS